MNDLPPPVTDAHPEGFGTLLVEASHRYILGAHAFSEYSVEVV